MGKYFIHVHHNVQMYLGTIPLGDARQRTIHNVVHVCMYNLPKKVRLYKYLDDVMLNKLPTEGRGKGRGRGQTPVISEIYTEVLK